MLGKRVPSRGVIFDLDGVLVDSEPLYTEATQAVVTPFGKTYDWSLKTKCMGRPATVSARIVVEELALPLSPEEFLQSRLGFLEQLFARVPAIPGAEELVSALSARGKRLAVATSSSRRMFALKTTPHAWFSHMSAIVCADDPELARPKPDPDIFLLAARRLGCAPSECTVFEDSPAGVAAGLAAGMRVIVVQHGPSALERVPDGARAVRAYSELHLDEL